MVEAETPEGSAGTAPAQEHTIPKHRFDEQSARLKEAEENNRVMREMLASQKPNPAVPEKKELKAEDFGVDEETFEAARAIADATLKEQIGSLKKTVEGHLVNQQNQIETLKFVQLHGQKAYENYGKKIQEHQTRVVQSSGSYMDMDTAYKLVRYDEHMATLEKTANKELADGAGQTTETQAAQTTATETQPPPAAPAASASTAPGKTGTGDPATGGTPPVEPANFGGHKTIEEWESSLDEKVPAGGF